MRSTALRWPNRKPQRLTDTRADMGKDMGLSAVADDANCNHVVEVLLGRD